MELVEFGADLRNLAVRMDQIEDVMKMEPIAEGACDTPPVSAELSFQDVSFSYGDKKVIDHVSLTIHKEPQRR